MYLYKKGAKYPFTILAEDHYNSLEAKRITKTRVSYYANSVNKKVIERMVDNGTNDHHFFEDLAEHNFRWLKEIIVGTPPELTIVISQFERHQGNGRYPPFKEVRGGKEQPTQFFQMIKEVFNYDSFSTKKAKYGAYDFCEYLQMSVCPYCNRNYTFTVFYRGKGMVRPELDHFVPKSKYPYLALSFYNLVPSCHLCNSNLKHATPMNFSDYIHPYINSMHDVIKFSVEFKKKKFSTPREIRSHYGIDFFYGYTDAFDIIVTFRKNVDIDLVRRANSTLSTFRIVELYNQHKDMVQEIIQSAIVYNDDYIDSIMQTFKDDLFRSREDVLRMLTHQYVTLEEMPKRPFSKLAWDVYEEFGVKF